MKFLSAACVLLLSSNASVVFGSNIQGAELEQGQRKQQSTRALGLRSGEIVGDDTSEKPMDDTDIVSELFNKLDDEDYDLLARSYNDLSDDIEIALLQVNPDLTEEDLVYAREAFVDFLENDNDVPDTTPDTSLPSSEFDTAEEDGSDGIDMDTLEKVDDELAGNDRDRQRGLASYNKHWNKGCRNYHGGKGSSGHDYDLYRHATHDYCKSKCNGLGHKCHGYEYDSHNRKCEVWRGRIQYVQYVHGLDCYIKR
eukprot:260845_1